MSDYDFFNTFIFRTPTLPAKDYYNLKRVLSSSLFEEALFIASPALHFSVYSEGLDLENINSKLKASLLKYLYRMSTRCTPFGNFAATGTGLINEGRSNILIDGVRSFNSVASIDIEFFYLLAKILEVSELGDEYICFFPNDSLYESMGEFRYIERRHLLKKDSFFLSQFKITPAAKSVIKYCTRGATKNELIEQLKINGYPEDDARKYLNDLIDNQILISDFHPSITRNNLTLFKKKLSQYSPVSDAHLAYLNNISDQLFLFKDLPLGTKMGALQKLITMVSQQKSLNAYPDLIKVNTYFNVSEAVINQDIKDLVKEGIEILNMLSVYKPNEEFDQFKTLFKDKYEGREIAITEILDPDIGIPFSMFNAENVRIHPLTQAMPSGKNKVKDGALPRVRYEMAEIIQKKYLECLRYNKTEIVLTKEDFEQIQPDWSQLSNTFSVGTEIIRAGNRGEPLINIKFAGGFSAATLLGRFSIDDDQIKTTIELISNLEESLLPHDTIIAEVAYIPDDLPRSKVLNRIGTYKYEILVSSNSELPKDNQLLIDDLFLSVDKNDHFVLRSKKLNRKVIPKNSTADYFKSSTNPFYYFLSLLQWNNGVKSHINFEWGDFYALEGAYPRVVFENKVILSPAKWHIENHTFRNKQNFEELFFEEREKRGLPDKFYMLAGSDNRLLIDCKNKDALSLLENQLNRSGVFIEEFFDFGEDPFVYDGQDVFHNEVFFQLHRSSL